MVLKNCPVCGRRMAADAKICPDCGFVFEDAPARDAAPRPKRGRLFLVLGVAAAVAAGVCICRNRGPSAGAGPQTVTSPAPAASAWIAETVPESIFGSYEGEDGGGLTISRDGTAIYYCDEEQFSEPDDRWFWEDGTIHIVLEKLHCTITAVPEGEGTDTLLFVSGSRNWSAERFRKLPAENELYRKSAMRSYDDNITILPDGLMQVAMDQMHFVIPKSFTDYPDNVMDHNPDHCLVEDIDVDRNLISGIMFSFLEERDFTLLEQFGEGKARSILMSFVYNPEISPMEHADVLGLPTYAFSFSGYMNQGFDYLSGQKVHGRMLLVALESEERFLSITALANEDGPYDFADFEKIMEEASL